MDSSAILADLRELASTVRQAQPHIDTARRAVTPPPQDVDITNDEIDRLNDLIAALDAGYRVGHTLARHVIELDNWLVGGGTLPEEWQALPGPRPADHGTLGQLNVSELVATALTETLGLNDRLGELGVDDQVVRAFIGSIGSRLAVAKGKL